MTRLDKFRQIGGYVKVIGQIALESFSPFIIILILLCGFMAAFRNRSVDKEADPVTNNSSSSFDKIDNFNGSFGYSFFQIYFMMHGDNKNEVMGIGDLTWPNLATFGIYFLFIFLISSLALNIFTGIAINEIHELLKAYKIRIIKDKIDYIYDGGYSIFECFKFFSCCEGTLEKLEKWLFKKVTKAIKGITWCVDKVKEECSLFILRHIVCCTICHHRKCICVDTKQSEKKLNPAGSDLNHMNFNDEKYVENFETLEYSVKTLEDKLDLIISNSSLPVSRTKELEDKLKNRIKESEDKLVDRIKESEGKLNTILEKLEQIMAKN
jgi:hypothetical protein